MGKLLAAAGSLAIVGLAAGCSSSSTVVNHASGSSSVAHVGDTLNLKTASGRPFQISATQVVDHAHVSGSAKANHNKRFIAALFTVTDSSDQAISGDANADANLVGADGQTYLPSHDTLRECGGHSTRYQVAAGKSGTTCVSFQLKNTVTVTRVQFFPAAGSASVYGEWLVP